jgi:hypothetical protein
MSMSGDHGGVARHHALAVDQHQGAFAAETAEVDGGGAGRAVGFEVAEFTEGLGQVVDQVFDVRHALQRDLLRTDGGDRADAGQVRRGNARTGDHDLADRGRSAGLLREGLSADGQGRTTDHR